VLNLSDKLFSVGSLRSLRRLLYFSLQPGLRISFPSSSILTAIVLLQRSITSLDLWP
jgi:hypothetical protein